MSRTGEVLSAVQLPEDKTGRQGQTDGDLRYDFAGKRVECEYYDKWHLPVFQARGYNNPLTETGIHKTDLGFREGGCISRPCRSVVS